jgi:hypothetical protein
MVLIARIRSMNHGTIFFNGPDRSDSLHESWNDFPDYSDRSMMHGTIFLIILIVL